MPLSTVSAVLKRTGWANSAGSARARRSLRAHRSGELIHIDVKKLGRIHRGAGHRVTGAGPQASATPRRQLAVTGWEFVHVAIDDYSRLAYAEILADERALTAIGFLDEPQRSMPGTGSPSSD